MWNKRAVEPEPESPGRGGRHRGPSHQIMSRPGELVEPVGTPNQARVSLGSWSTPPAHRPGPSSPGPAGRPCGTLGMARDTRDSWLKKRSRAQVGAERELPTRSGQPHLPSDTGLRRPGYLVEPAGHQNRARVIRDRRSTPQELQSGPESPRTVGRPCGHLDTRPSHPGQLVDLPGRATPSQSPGNIW